MKIPPAPPFKQDPLSPKKARQTGDDPRISPEMRKAAEGLEAVFTGEMMKAMRQTVDESEFSLKNSATEIYQSLLDQEYSETAAKQNSLGLSRQILDYWLRSMPQEHYTEKRTNTGQTALRETNGAVRPASTGGTHEGQSE